MRKLLALVCLVGLVGRVRAQHLVFNLGAPVDAVAPGGTVQLDLIVLNPSGAEAVCTLPPTLAGHLSEAGHTWPVTLQGKEGGGGPVAAGGFSSWPYVFTVPTDARGQLLLDLPAPQHLRAVIEVQDEPASTEQPPTIVVAPLSNVLSNRPVAQAIQRSFAGRFAAHEPV
ncbi:MAG: hypothetical protein ACHQ4G_03890 [Opitutales bacterium]